jgi:hypothetical protein
MIRWSHLLPAQQSPNPNRTQPQTRAHRRAQHRLAPPKALWQKALHVESEMPYWASLSLTILGAALVIVVGFLAGAVMVVGN